MASDGFRVFSRKEKESLENRLRGDYRDPTGVFSNRTRPKILELLETWIPRRKDLKQALQQHKKRGTKQ